MKSDEADTQQTKIEKEQAGNGKGEEATPSDMKKVLLNSVLLSVVELFRSYSYLIRDREIAKRLYPVTIRQFEEYLAINEYRHQADIDSELDMLGGRKGRTKPLSVPDLTQNAKKIVFVWEALSFLAGVLQEAYGKPCLVLIDEYDTPFNEAHQSGILNYALDLLSPMLLGVLKVFAPVRFPCFVLTCHRAVLLSSVLLLLAYRVSPKLRCSVGLII